jgi:protein-disulfide isomerase
MAGGPQGEDGPVPPQVTAHWVPGKVTIVEVADFDCPHCRHLHAVLQELLREEGERVRLVQLTAPMPAHRHARDASRAFLCAGQQGKGREMGEALFSAEKLTPQACEDLAVSLGLSRMDFRSCVAAPETDQQLDAEVAWVKAAGLDALPVLWVGQRRLSGSQSLDALRQAVREAEQGLPGRPAQPAPPGHLGASGPGTGP